MTSTQTKRNTEQSGKQIKKHNDDLIDEYRYCITAHGDESSYSIIQNNMNQT